MPHWTQPSRQITPASRWATVGYLSTKKMAREQPLPLKKAHLLQLKMQIKVSSTAPSTWIISQCWISMIYSMAEYRRTTVPWISPQTVPFWGTQRWPVPPWIWTREQMLWPVRVLFLTVQWIFLMPPWVWTAVLMRYLTRFYLYTIMPVHGTWRETMPAWTWGRTVCCQVISMFRIKGLSPSEGKGNWVLTWLFRIRCCTACLTGTAIPGAGAWMHRMPPSAWQTPSGRWTETPRQEIWNLTGQ